MGFECGFNSLTRAHNCTIEQAVYLNELVSMGVSEFPKDNVDSDMENKFNYYRYHKEGQYEDELSYNINYWCSAGRDYLDNFIISHLEKIDEFHYKGINKEFIEKGISWASQELCKTKLIPIQITKAYTDESNKVGSLVECKGIEVIDDRGNRRFINVEKDYLFMTDGEEYDEDRQYVLESFIDTLNLISKMDLENNLVWYYRSY